MATWTPDALSRERRRLSGTCWRIVEAQHRVSTMKLADTLADQTRLEELIEESKPPVPPECRPLHYLLATPFRYGAPYPSGSRFRRAGFTPGVFYGSKTIATGIAEAAFHRLLFFAESPRTPWPDNADEFTAFSVRYGTPSGLDLRQPPLDRDATIWTHPTDYPPCQEFADAARAADIDVLRYLSARDPGPPRGINVAVLRCRAFSSREPLERQTWRVHLGEGGVRALSTFPDVRIGFGPKAFSDDPRIRDLRWKR